MINFEEDILYNFNIYNIEDILHAYRIRTQLQITIPGKSGMYHAFLMHSMHSESGSIRNKLINLK